MAVSQKLEMRQGQSLVMTPQLQQAIKLLQMSNQELSAFVEAELEKNPLLEREESKETDNQPGPAQDESTASQNTADSAPGNDDERLVLPGEGDVNKTLANMDTDLGNVYADEALADRQDRAQPAGVDSSWSSVGTSGTGGSFEREGINFENTLAQEKTLADSLSEQLQLSIADHVQRIIGQHLLGTLNDSGYITADLSSVAKTLGIAQSQVEDVLSLLQTFEPTGVCARDLRECLKLQLEEKNRYDPAMSVLLDNLDLLAKRDFKELTRLCKVDQQDLYDMVSEIRELDPKPGHSFGGAVPQPVIPDVIVRAAPDGTWLVELNSETLPRVLVNNQYYAMVSANTTHEKDKVYISECHNNATWLVKSLEQRAHTILAVSREIVRQQDAFLIAGVSALKPLNLRDVADVIDMHESTVSRVTSNKFVQTPRGVFELKYFFTTAIASTSGETEYSAESIRYIIKQLIDNETVEKVLSDDAIVDLLRGRGVDIARRTVAKYRESMGIASSVQRRREKRAAF